MTRDLYLAIDVGTGGLRSALVDRDGRILAFSHKEHEQIVPRFGWSAQRPADWWAGTQATIRDVLDKDYVNLPIDRIEKYLAGG